jgi:hypothetical protein
MDRSQRRQAINDKIKKLNSFGHGHNFSASPGLDGWILAPSDLGPIPADKLLSILDLLIQVAQ